MTVFGKGLLVGLIVAVLSVGLATRTTTFEAFVRVGTGGHVLLDIRQDEPVVSRVVNAPVAALGEATLAKRSWVVATTYGFFLQLRPQVAPGPGRAVESLQVSVSLPGRVLASNATRITNSGAVWETLPAEGLHVQTRTIHWVRIIAFAFSAAVLFLLTGRH